MMSGWMGGVRRGLGDGGRRGGGARVSISFMILSPVRAWGRGCSFGPGGVLGFNEVGFMDGMDIIGSIDGERLAM